MAHGCSSRILCLVEHILEHKQALVLKLQHMTGTAGFYFRLMFTITVKLIICFAEVLYQSIFAGTRDNAQSKSRRWL